MRDERRLLIHAVIARALYTFAVAVLLVGCIGQTVPMGMPPVPARVPSPVSVDAVATAMGPGAQAPARLSALQKGIEGSVTRDDLVSVFPSNASMGVLPMMAGEIQPDWIAVVVAANNFGPAAANVGELVGLRDRQGRGFPPLTTAQFPQYEELLRAIRQQRQTALGDRPLLPYTNDIQPFTDAFFLLVFVVTPDSDELALAAR